MESIDFEGLARDLLSRARELLPTWLPGGRLIGKEFSCGSLRGESGDSLKVNINTGMWADFAGNEKGGDLISLYAAIEKITQVEAARKLSDQTGFKPPVARGHVAKPAEAPEQAYYPPAGTEVPDALQRFEHFRHGKPKHVWFYRSAEGNLLFCVARYDTPDGKQIIPWSWDKFGRWIGKGLPAPRPLYNLDYLRIRPNAPVLIVEGEKTAQAAIKIAGKVYVVITWPNGSKAVDKADWKPIYGRKVLIWPDADEPGMAAAKQIAGILSAHCPEIKIINTTGDYPVVGWDADDALNDGMNWETFKAWAKPLAQLFEKPAAIAELVESTPEKDSVELNINMPDPEDSGEISGSMWSMWEKLGIPTTAGGQPICNIDSGLRVLEGLPALKDVIWYDEFHQRYFTRWNTGVLREWSDTDDIDFTRFMQRSLGLRRMSDELIGKVVKSYAHKHKRNEPHEWLESLTWDGTPRIRHFFTNFMGAERDLYIEEVAKNFWIGMVARIYRPGCQLDNMVVLEGAQGLRKTSAMRLVGGAWYAESKESVQDKDFFMVLTGKLLIEIGELGSFTRSENTRIKQVVTCATDRYRSPYERRPKDHPRMCVFVGTTNKRTWLDDETGARRFWPVHCGQIDLELIAEHRAQLYAEAVHRFKAGESWWEVPKELALAQQEDRRQGDAWEDAIEEYLKFKYEVQVREIAWECLRIEIAKLDKSTQMRIANSLTALNWERKTVWREKKSMKVWMKKV